MLGKKEGPSTFEIALGLSLMVFVLAVIFTKPHTSNHIHYGFEVMKYWQRGFWELMEFTMQMILILVFGHALAISGPIKKRLVFLASRADSNTKAVLITGITALLGGYLNWGFGLILGALLAKQIGLESAKNNSIINYPLVVASGYLGMLVWHGGLSGSAPLKVAEADHFLVSTTGIIGVNETLFSNFNILVNAILILVLMITLYFFARKKPNKLPIDAFFLSKQNKPAENGTDTDKIGRYLGLFIVALAVSDIFLTDKGDWGFMDLNFINFTLLGVGLFAFGSLKKYIMAIGVALQGATDILLQFPFYAGILGIMKYSGLLVLMAGQIVSHSNINTFPLFSFLSAAIINLFVPSGGGQWAIQGPVIMEAALQMGLDPAKMILAFSYGDQVTNMLQPFWALPLLSITGVSAKNLFQYTFYFFLIGFIVFGLGVFLFVN